MGNMGHSIAFLCIFLDMIMGDIGGRCLREEGRRLLKKGRIACFSFVMGLGGGGIEQADRAAATFLPALFLRAMYRWSIAKIKEYISGESYFSLSTCIIMHSERCHIHLVHLAPPPSALNAFSLTLYVRCFDVFVR